MTCSIASSSEVPLTDDGDAAWLHLDQASYPVRVRETRRRTLGLYVFGDGRIEVRVPRGTPRSEALAFARGRKRWLRETVANRPAPPPEPVYRDGASHPYRGEALTLRVRSGARRRARLAGEVLWLTVPDPNDSGAVESVLREWYRRRARSVFGERLAAWFPALGLPASAMPGLRIRAMRSRWGSCSSRGGVNLNLWLIRAPLACIDYVIVHELCHLLEFNHSSRFYAHMDRILPDWRHRRDALRAHQQRWG